MIVSAANDLSGVAKFVDEQRHSGGTRPTAETVHGAGHTEIRAADLTLMGWEGGGASDLDRAIFESCLFDSGRPLIVLPPNQALRTPPDISLPMVNPPCA